MPEGSGIRNHQLVDPARLPVSHPSRRRSTSGTDGVDPLPFPNTVETEENHGDVGDDSGEGAGHDAECHPEQRGEDPQDEAMRR